MTSRAFERREPQGKLRGDPTGVSINTTAPAAIQYLDRPVGILHLQCDDVRRLTNPFTHEMLDVLLNAETHGNIVNIPYYRTDYPDAQQQQLEDLLTTLAKMSKLLPDAEFDELLAAKTRQKAKR